MAEIEYPKTVTELTVAIADDYHDDIDSDDPCAEVKQTVLNDVGYITVRFESGRTFSIHVREVNQEGESVA